MAVNAGASGAVVSSVRLPLPSVLLPAASVLLRVMFLRPSEPRLKLPDVGVATPVSRLQAPALLAVTW